MWQFIVHLGDIVQIAPEIHLLIWSCGILLVMAFLKNNPRYRLAPTFLALAGIGVSAFTYIQQVQYFLSQGLVSYGSGAERPVLASAQLYFNGMYSVDGMSLFFKGFFLLAGFFTVLLSTRFLEEERVPKAEYFAILLMSIMAMMFLTASSDLVTIYISLEFMAITVYILVGYLKHQQRSVEASLKYFVLGAFSSTLILFGMSLLYGMAGSTNLELLRQALSTGAAVNKPVLLMAMLLIFAGVGFKIAVVPFHMWCPDAYEGAPTPFTAFMSVAPMAAGFALFIRLFISLFKPLTPSYVSMVGLLAIITMTVGNVLAVKQTNVKRLLAYSSISHAGYLLMGMMVRDSFGLQAMGVYLVCYLFMNLGAFAVLVLLHRKGVSGEEIGDFAGFIHSNPAVAVFMVIFLLSLAGIPPTAGFIAKYWVFAVVIKSYLATTDRIYLYVAVAGALNAVVALYYYFRIVKEMFMTEGVEAPPLAANFTARVGLYLALLGTLAVGVYPDPVIQLSAWIGRAFAGMF